MDRRRARSWAAPLWHPLPLAATLLLALNDQVFKGAELLPQALVGKLSDVCGLFVFPALIVACVQLAWRLVSPRAAPLQREARRWRLDAVALLLTALGFAAANLSPSFNALLARVWIDKLMDPSDLWALFALLPSAWWLRRCRTASTAPATLPWGRWLALAAVLLACAATQPPRHPRAYAVWQLPEKHSARVGAATVQAWVSKSGKGGCGVTLRVESPRPLKLVDAALSVQGGPRVRADGTLPRLVAQGGAAVEHAYVAFVFDNEAAWNAGLRRGALELELEIDGQRQRLRIAAEHVRPANHRRVPRRGDPGIQPRDLRGRR
ncbi:MAG: hypothetical protein KC503_20530 [Myxococcales bacterium]|nr:hypothetical protein [Myxococcales bacterium]